MGDVPGGSLDRLLAAVRAVVREEITRASTRLAPSASRMLPAAQADRRFHLRKGTSALAVKAGTVRGRVRPRGARSVVFVDSIDAERVWGVAS